MISTSKQHRKSRQHITPRVELSLSCGHIVTGKSPGSMVLRIILLRQSVDVSNNNETDSVFLNVFICPSSA